MTRAQKVVMGEAVIFCINTIVPILKIMIPDSFLCPFVMLLENETLTSGRWKLQTLRPSFSASQSSSANGTDIDTDGNEAAPFTPPPGPAVVEEKKNSQRRP
jgi:hypothetical protein